MKAIGFVDYYISEWHADNYPHWIKEAGEKMGLEYEVAYAWALKDISEYNGKSTEEWCKEFKVTPCRTAKELCEKSDCIIVLAPSNPEKHLELVKAVFPYAMGKRFYIDKTFAPDVATAKEIYALAKKYNITFFSTSALRYAAEISEDTACDSVITYGGGGNFEEYVIHQAEIIVKTMGTDIARVNTVNTETGHDCLITFKDGRVAELHYASDLGFRVLVENAGKKREKQITSDFFRALIEKILIFFERGETDFDAGQTLAVMALREAAIKSKNNNGAWVEL